MWYIHITFLCLRIQQKQSNISIDFQSRLSQLDKCEPNICYPFSVFLDP